MQDVFQTLKNLPQTHSARVDPSGRIVLPAEVRERLGIKPGDTLVLQDEGIALRVQSYDQALADAQAFCANLAPPEVSLADELIADRRVEAAREAVDE